MLNKIIAVTALVLSCISIGFLVYRTGMEKSKEVFVKTETLFNEFKLTKELKAKFENVASTRKNMLDSLMMDLRYSYNDKNFPKEKYAEKEKYYLNRKELFESQNQELTENYDHQIWERLNQYLKDFGEQTHYDYIYGARGDGNLLYAAEKNDITKEAIEFINNKYDGK